MMSLYLVFGGVSRRCRTGNRSASFQRIDHAAIFSLHRRQLHPVRARAVARRLGLVAVWCGLGGGRSSAWSAKVFKPARPSAVVHRPLRGDGLDGDRRCRGRWCSASRPAGWRCSSPAAVGLHGGRDLLPARQTACASAHFVWHLFVMTGSACHFFRRALARLSSLTPARVKALMRAKPRSCVSSRRAAAFLFGTGRALIRHEHELCLVSDRSPHRRRRHAFVHAVVAGADDGTRAANPPWLAGFVDVELDSRRSRSRNRIGPRAVPPRCAVRLRGRAVEALPGAAVDRANEFAGHAIECRVEQACRVAFGGLPLGAAVGRGGLVQGRGLRARSPQRCSSRASRFPRRAGEVSGARSSVPATPLRSSNAIASSIRRRASAKSDEPGCSF